MFRIRPEATYAALLPTALFLAFLIFKYRALAPKAFNAVCDHPNRSLGNLPAPNGLADGILTSR